MRECPCNFRVQILITSFSWESGGRIDNDIIINESLNNSKC